MAWEQVLKLQRAPPAAGTPDRVEIEPRAGEIDEKECRKEHRQAAAI